MKKIGKILAALTAVTLCVGALPAVQVALPRVSIAASAESADGLTYQLINDSTEVAITGCDDVTSVIVPSEIEGKPGNNDCRTCIVLKVQVAESNITG